MDEPTTPATALHQAHGRPKSYWINTPAGERFWNSRIPNLEALKALNRTHAFLAIDLSARKVHGEMRILDLGLGLVRKLKPEKTCSSLTEFRRSHKPTVRVFNVEDERRNRRNHENQRFGSRENVRASELEKIVSRYVKHLKNYTIKGNKPLILVGYCLTMEFQIIARKLQSLASYVDAWVDLQEIVCELEPTNSLRSHPPSQLDVLEALGLEDGVDRQISLHSGNDVVRTLALMATLMRLGADDTRLVVPRAWEKKARAMLTDRPVLPGRPHPPSQYPYVVRVYARGWVCPKAPLREASKCWVMFAAYNPTGVWEQGAHMGGDKCKNCNKAYYVSLPSREAVRGLINEFNGLRSLSGHVVFSLKDESHQDIGQGKGVVETEKALDRQDWRDGVEVTWVDALEAISGLFFEDS